MSNSGEHFSVIYWNSLMKADQDAQMRYVEAMATAEEPFAMIFTEMPTANEKRLKQLFNFVSMKTTVVDHDLPEGQCVVSQAPLNVRRDSPWPAIHYDKKLKFGYLHDEREIVSFDVATESLGTLAIVGGHITHDHHWWRPGIGMRRPLEWGQHNRFLREQIAAGKEFIWVGDTNTATDYKFRSKLLYGIDGDVIGGYGATWGLWSPNAPKVLRIDKVAASRKLLPAVSVERVPAEINGARCPSDHAAVVIRVDDTPLARAA
jgi:hypothetical protein